MARSYGSELDIRLTDPAGVARRVAVTDDFALVIEDASFEATAFGMGAKIYDYVRQYGASAFDLSAYADDAGLVNAPLYSGFSRVCPLRVADYSRARTLSFVLRTGLSVAFGVIFPSRTLSLSHGTEAHKRMVNIQPTGAITVTGDI